MNATAELMPRYRVTCPECGAASITEWTDILPPGGVSPVRCSACGYMILSESEGDPVEIADRAPPWARGYVHVYTGDGKGKTTAALGLALRAAGAGVRVFIAQFAKGRASAEHVALGRFRDLIALRHCGGAFLRGEPGPEDVRLARECFREAREAVMSGDYAVAILDEANIATHFGLLAVEDLLALIDDRPPEVEIVITGRWADPRVVERADLVTEMRDAKHYFARGVRPRAGIER
jgi:cob(I)alamin adenosyltransferase